MQNRNTDKIMAQYLLGELSEEERERIERQYLADPDFFDELLAVEDDLLDEYARGELQGRRREQFERGLAAPRQRERLRDAQILMKRLDVAQVPASPDREQQERSSWFAFINRRQRVPALAFSALVLLAIASWLTLRTARLQEQVERMQAEQSAAQQRERVLREKLDSEQKAKEDLLRQLQQGIESGGTNGHKDGVSTEKRNEPRVATFTLVPSLMRGGEAGNFVLPRGVEIVQLEVQLVDVQYRSYHAEVQTADGERVYQQSGLTAQRAQSGKVIRIKIPTRLLRGRDYVMKVSGLAARGNLEDAGLYSFRILHN